MSFDDLPPAEISFTVAELAHLWRCSRRHVYNLIDAGQLKTFTIGTGTRGIRIRLEEKHRWEDQEKQSQPSADEAGKPSSSFQLKALTTSLPG